MERCPVAAERASQGLFDRWVVVRRVGLVDVEVALDRADLDHRATELARGGVPHGGVEVRGAGSGVELVLQRSGRDACQPDGEAHEEGGQAQEEGCDCSVEQESDQILGRFG